MQNGFDALDLESKRHLVDEIRKKKNGLLEKEWIELCDDYALAMNAETLRKAGVGIQLADEAGMLSNCVDAPDAPSYFDTEKIQRQKRILCAVSPHRRNTKRTVIKSWLCVSVTFTLVR